MIPVWLATWELDCCQADFAVGDSWATRLVTYDDVRPSADGSDGRNRRVGNGPLHGNRRARREGGHDLALVRVGSFRIAVQGLRATGTVAGAVKLHFEGHGPGQGGDPEEVLITGTVRRIERVPIIYREVRPRGFEVAGYRDPVDVMTTRERCRHDALLITLEPGMT